MNALLTALYVFFVVSFMTFSTNLFGSVDEGGIVEDNIFMPIFMLLLLVFSAGLTAMLVFGRPILWYLDGKKKEALELLVYTFLFFFVILLVVFILILTV